MKLETERREDKRSLLQEKAARNINKLTAARRDRKVVRRVFVFRRRWGEGEGIFLLLSPSFGQLDADASVSDFVFLKR